MRNFLIATVCLAAYVTAGQARTLGLDSLRHLALQGNKSLRTAYQEIEIAKYEHKAAKTKYLPHVSLDGAYLYNSRSTQLLSDDQQERLSQLGTGLGQKLKPYAEQIAAQNPQLVPLIQSLGTPMVSLLNGIGNDITDALRTPTHNIYAGGIILTQPLYFGGKIKAYDQITHYSTLLLGAKAEKIEQDIIYSVDQAYWQVVSLSTKKHLAETYVQMLEKLESDIDKMYKEGVATKAQTLTVSVKKNEADVNLTRVEDGLSLAKMLLCQICGLPLSESLQLEDEDKDEIVVSTALPEKADTLTAFQQRKDLQALAQATKMAEANVKLVKSDFMPTLSAIGGYSMTNPNVYNGFKNRFGGNFMVGVTLHVPLWGWNEGHYKIEAAKLKWENRRLAYLDAKDKIELQVNQAQFRANEARKKLQMARKNQEKADENLKYANVGFHEGVIATSDMLEAQTAWLQARSEKLDAEIDVKLTEIYLSNSMGNMK